MTHSPIITLEEAAALLLVRPNWLRRSHCPRIRMGNIVRYDRDAVIAWFRAHSTANGRAA
jgi:hypothetical protein